MEKCCYGLRKEIESYSSCCSIIEYKGVKSFAEQPQVVLVYYLLGFLLPALLFPFNGSQKRNVLVMPFAHYSDYVLDRSSIFLRSCSEKNWRLQGNDDSSCKDFNWNISYLSIQLGTKPTESILRVAEGCFRM